jgi:5-formaminoimidazole-4-carboxamide-1-beta-D-ribofuranosyl 5'-monophosphate synthetase
MIDVEYLNFHYKKLYGIELEPSEQKYENFQIDENMMFMAHDYTALQEDVRYDVFGNLPIDRTSTREDDLERMEHILDINGDQFLKVPAKNVLTELYM